MAIKARVASAARVGFEFLPEPARVALRRTLADGRGLTQLKRNQGMLALRLAELERRADAGQAPPAAITDPRFPAGVTSRICTQAQVDQEWFGRYCTMLGEEPRPHRKVWEHAYLTQVADRLGLLAPGVRGLGFGVGKESIVAAFAGRGCEIVATDLDPTDLGARVWSHTDQHAATMEALERPDLCPVDQFTQRVTWRPVDMRHIPADLVGFDFCWSACSLEHLGSLQAGLDFVRASIGTLRSGGYALHTTEFNLGSDDETVTEGPTVLYRRRDLRQLAAELEADGHEVAALDLAPGTGALDAYVDLPPFLDAPHLTLLHGRHTITSVALVVRAG